ncbi:riboflavin synthase [Alphaproteobacteria bacterium]|nr:riboflavin synthase [Alphaproteobacteria bacterium]MDC1023297.1 riboflavin synthase [Alphaproteobacteria bacterium]
MFTGIIGYLGEIKSISHPNDWEISISIINNDSSKISFENEKMLIGSSISCSGICLTLKNILNGLLFFDISNETASKTNFLNWKIGSIINIERSLKVGDELGGHFVYGHVDTTAKVHSIEQIEGSYKVSFITESDYIKYVATKGSVSIDGVSLTVNEVTYKTFYVNIIPFTWANTSFKSYTEDTIVNIEIDIFARYLERLNEAK